MENEGWIWQGMQDMWPQVAVGLVLLTLILLWLGYRRSNGMLPRRFLAMLCKLAVLFLLILCLLEPMLVKQTAKTGENVVLMLADNSASLALQDPDTGKPFGESLPPIFDHNADNRPAWRSKLEEIFRVHVYSFDDRLHEQNQESKLSFKSPRSALVTSLEGLEQRYKKQPLAALLLFTDGNATDAAQLEKLLAQKPTVPIYPVVMGWKKEPSDLALKSVDVTQTPFEDSPVTLTAQIGAHGFAGQEIALLIRDEAGKVVQTEKHVLQAEERVHTFVVRFRPEKMGLSFFKVSIQRSTAGVQISDETKRAAESGEATLENNQRLVAIDRKTGPYRVLYVSGRPNWDYKFMRRALEADDEVKLVSLIRMAKREPKFVWRGRDGESSNPLFRGFKSDVPEEERRYDQPVLVRLGIRDKQELADGFPRTADELFSSYRAIILDDIEAGFFTQEQMTLLERFVSVRGGSLLMMGGQESFKLGGYEHTPVGRMLPVYLDQAGASHAVEDVHFNLTREGWLEPWMRLRATETEEEMRMAKMPTFFSVNRTTAIKPGASILATVVDADKKSYPAWVVQRYGSGRVASVMLGDVWRWGMRDPDSHKDMDKSWRQLLRWLVVDVPERVELQNTITAAGSHELINPQVRVRDKAFLPQDDAVVKIEVEEPENGHLDLTAEPSNREAGLFDLSSHASKAGAYRIKASVVDGTGTEIGSTSTGWALNPAAEEFQSLMPNRALLERLATWSGGRVLEMNDLADWANAMPNVKLPIMETRTEPLWHQWWFLLLLVGLLGTEWWLRRRQGWR
ncbi:Ig-like domain-containing protein [soil metagenome]